MSSWGYYPPKPDFRTTRPTVSTSKGDYEWKPIKFNRDGTSYIPASVPATSSSYIEPRVTSERPIVAPALFGPPMWATIHILAASYDSTQQGALEFAKFIGTLEYNIPCKACRASFSRHLTELPIREYLSDRVSLLYWSYQLHDIVNKELGKNSPTWEVVKSYYLSRIH